LLGEKHAFDDLLYSVLTREHMFNLFHPRWHKCSPYGNWRTLHLDHHLETEFRV